MWQQGIIGGLTTLTFGIVTARNLSAEPPVVEIRTGDRVVRIEPLERAAPVDRQRTRRSAIVRPGPRSPFGMAVLGETRRGPRPLSMRLKETTARVSRRRAGPLALRVVNDAPFGVAVSLHVDGLPAPFGDEAEAAFVPARSSSVLTADRLERPARQITVLLRTARGADEPDPAIDPIGPARRASLVRFDERAGTIERFVGRTPIAAITVIVAPEPRRNRGGRR